MTPRRAALIAAALAVAIPRTAGAEPLHFVNGGTVTTPRGTVLELPPGYYLADDAFAALDAELRRAQDAETRLRAENESFRKSARDGGGWAPWALAAGAFAAGIAIGARAL